ncbi:MAG: DUF3499 family protein [Acidimicrobiales bacterium]
MSRVCARPSCSQPAGATLEYNYADGVVWLGRLASENHPMTHDLCERHAGRLRLPRGWRLVDTFTDLATDTFTECAADTCGNHQVSAAHSPGVAAV